MGFLREKQHRFSMGLYLGPFVVKREASVFSKVSRVLQFFKSVFKQYLLEYGRNYVIISESEPKITSIAVLDQCFIHFKNPLKLSEFSFDRTWWPHCIASGPK